MNSKTTDRRYLEILSEMYPTISQASTEIINLQSILNLPKGTEHFMSDIHGEFGAFSHVLKNGSGAVQNKVDDVFGRTLSESEKRSLATLIYYPREKTEYERNSGRDMADWYKVTLYRLIEVCKTASSKYTRSKVRKALPQEYAYVIEELITEKPEVQNKEAYYDAIIDTIIEIGGADGFIVALSELIQRLVVDHLHIIGDIFDRGSGAHFIMDKLCEYHSLDIQWGNHDVLWMGAAVGHPGCIATVIRISIRYGNLDMLEDGYGINLMPLARFAEETYSSDPCDCFSVKELSTDADVKERKLLMQMQKAIFIIEAKLQGALVKKRPEFCMEDRTMLDKIDYKSGTVFIEGKSYPMKDMYFPTIDPSDPFKLTPGETEVVERLRSSFMHCEKLKRHTGLLLKKGNLYKIYNGNLLYHGCMPLNPDGSFKSVNVYGREYSGRELYDVLESYVRKAFISLDPEECGKGADILWYLWCAPDSPLFGRHKMATFERYFLDDEDIQKEIKDRYYYYLDKPDIPEHILEEFGLDPQKGHIINGHVPVKRLKGESPVKAGGKLIVIDGGFAKPYQKETGIAGYTLIYNSHGLTLTAHESFASPDLAIKGDTDMVSSREIVESFPQRQLVGDTDTGKSIRRRITELKDLIRAYRLGGLTEKSKK